MTSDYIHLEHDGKLLLVNNDGECPAIPKPGRVDWIGNIFLIRLPTVEEVSEMGIDWIKKREKNIVF